MQYVEHQITLVDNYGDRLPPIIGARLLHHIEPAVRSATLMAIEGRGVARRRPPKWLQSASDVRFRGISGVSDTVFHFEAPVLGEAAEDLYRQHDFWRSPPDPGDTSFDLLGDVILDIQSENSDSDRFDQGVLSRVRKLTTVFDRGVSRMLLGGHRFEAKPAVISPKMAGHIDNLSRTTPQPQTARVVGKVDMIRKSTHTFALMLDDGSELSGTAEGEMMDRLRDFFGQRIVISGEVVYRPSGRALRIDADRVEASSDIASLWSRVPEPLMAPVTIAEIRKLQGSRSGVAAIIGQWPGDESDEEVEKALNFLS